MGLPQQQREKFPPGDSDARALTSAPAIDGGGSARKTRTEHGREKGGKDRGGSSERKGAKEKRAMESGGLQFSLSPLVRKREAVSL